MNLHPVAWLTWVSVMAIITMVARNPLYTLILLTATLLVSYGQSRLDEGHKLPLLQIAVAVLVFSAIYNALFVHFGQTVLFRLPSWPLIGGPLTLEALTDGLRNGLVLITLLAVFAALNVLVRVGDLVRLVPAGLQDLGVVVLIALTYVPQTRRHLQQIREAQAIRGHELRGLRDWRPVLIPLLIGGLERAMRIAEVMVARGFGTTVSVEARWLERVGTVMALTTTLLGWLLLLWIENIGWFMLFVGFGALGILLWKRGRSAQRTRYRQMPWGWPETVTVLLSVIALLIVVLPVPFIGQTSLSYSPYPRLSVPQFDPWMGALLASLALPAFLANEVTTSGERVHR
ncbi:MAG: energy-coupling factor transporter transmembrane component T [Candidatus Promineifilaceae bacterium]|nr:energy-coupling factor transporter transmembrane component T [Candidatus Promineifilaceae bacterium]